MVDPITSAGPIRKTATLLFYGWGYNFYREENQVRADDLLIRSKVGGILADARRHLMALETQFRRTYLPAPTRDAPYPDKTRIEQARRIGRSSDLIEAVATAIQSAPTPTADFVWLRHRSELGLLEILQGIDVRLVDAAVAFHDAVIERNLAAVSGDTIEDDINAGLEPLRVIIRERAERLTLMA
jgi:hypothetical protein